MSMSPESVADTPQALYFGPPERRLFGVLHRSSAPVDAPFAVLMVSPWGAENMSTQRALRELAQAIAQLGFTCLRFDLDGCGDSYDPGPDENYWTLWHQSVGFGIDTLKSHAAVSQVVLVGMRLGALLSAELAAVRQDVAALALLAPVRSGQAYLKELRILGSAMAQGHAQTPEAVFAAGFSMNRQTADALKFSVLPDRIHAKGVAVIDRDDLGIGCRWIDQLSSRGVTTFYSVQPGYSDMVLTAHMAKPAQLMFDKVLEALSMFSRQLNTPSPRPLMSAMDIECSAVFQVGQQSVEETVLVPFGAMGMSSIRVAPGAGIAPSGRGVLILNSSTEHRVGPNRMWVGFARSRAAKGDVVIRLDMPGIGESLNDYADEENRVYAARAIEFVGEYFQTLFADESVREWAAMGLCSGAYHSVRLAVSQPGVSRVFALNSLGFITQDVERANLWEHGAIHYIAGKNATRALWKPQRWLKLLRGQVNFKLITRSVAGRMRLWLRKHVLWAGHWLRLSQSSTLTIELRQLTQQECRVHFIFATTDPGLALLRDEMLHDFPVLLRGGYFTVDRIEDADHTFAGLKGRENMLLLLHQRFDDWLPTAIMPQGANSARSAVVPAHINPQRI